MATQNSIDANIPTAVSKGGTGAATLTDYGVLIGSGIDPITPLSAGATGSILIGTSTADPAFGTSAGGDFTFTSTTASATRVLTISNTDNTGSATSSATVSVTTAGSSAGNAQVTYTVTGGGSFSIGTDNAATGDPFKISSGTALGTNDAFITYTGGEITLPLQPAFGACASNLTNVTGDGTVYAMAFDTEYFDQNSDYNVNGTFTAPVTGKFQFNVAVTFSGIGSAHNDLQIRLITSNNTYTGGQRNLGVIMDSATSYYSASFSILADMDVTDTATVSIYVNGDTKTVDVLGVSSLFNGMLVC